MRRRFASLLVTIGSALAIASTSDARAQSAIPPSGAAAAGAPVETEWYGWQTLLVDGAALGTMIVGFATGSGEAALTGFGLYVLGPPIVHIAHLRVGVAVGDLLLRLATPFVFSVIGLAIDGLANPCTHNGSGFEDLCFPGLVGGGIGLVIGYATAVAVDAAYFARAPIAKRSNDTSAYRLRWTPIVGPTRGGLSAGVSAVF